jgi:hypothetical protein
MLYIDVGFYSAANYAKEPYFDLINEHDRTF